MTYRKRPLRPAIVLLAAVASLCLSAAAHAEQRYVRYRLVAPEVDTVATAEIMPHAFSQTITVSSEHIPLPGVMSRHGLYVEPGQWSGWCELPRPPVWGTIYLKIRAAEPLRQVTADVQLATTPDEKNAVRTMRISGSTGGTVGFVLPANVLANPEQVETIEETIRRRRRLAESVAVPEARRPKLLSFSPAGVRDDPSIADSGRREFETVALLGFNTAYAGEVGADAVPAIRFRSTHDTGRSKEQDQARFAKYLASGGGRPPILYSVLVDEPNWEEGFDTLWKETGVKGFHDFLREHNVDPRSLGLATLDEVAHLDRRRPVAADAPLEQRRLWYWSCRYTYDLNARFFRRLTDTTRATLPDTATTVNFADHTIILGSGTVAGTGPDFFSLGRRASLGMYWSEDWMFPTFASWGNGLYQRVPYLVSMMRGAARHHHQPHPNLGFYVISVGYNPFGEGIDRTVGVRVLLLLGRGVKTFSFFNYGPTARGTVDFWADDAPAVRGAADALGMIGDPVVEPLLYEGQPAPAQTCLVYSTPAEYWQAANGADADNHEKQYLYAMLTQRQIGVDVVDAPDLPKFVGGYKAAYMVDRNLPRASAEALRRWVEDDGGVLCLWPTAATRDEFNEPLDAFPAATGDHPLGRGRVVRFGDRPGTLWWESTQRRATASGSTWPSEFDAEHRERAVRPALELAKVDRPVVVSAADVTADALVSDRGVAVPLVNLRGTLDRHGTRHLNLKVTLADAEGITRVYSSRCGELTLRREGRSAAVVMPLDSTDVVVFLKQ